MAMRTLCTVKKARIYANGDTLHWQTAPIYGDGDAGSYIRASDSSHAIGGGRAPQGAGGGGGLDTSM